MLWRWKGFGDDCLLQLVLLQFFFFAKVVYFNDVRVLIFSSFLKQLFIGVVVGWIDGVASFGPFIIKGWSRLKELYAVKYPKNSRGSQSV
jgi:hypothetical protein